MEQPRSDETLRDFMERRERELTLQVSALLQQLAPKEHELSEIRRTKVALGIIPGARAGHEVERERIALREETCRSLSAAIDRAVADPEAHKNMTIKELIALSFARDFARDATPAEIGEHIRKAYRRDVGDGSVRPNLARLKEEGIMIRNAAGKWEFDPIAIDIMTSTRPIEKAEDTDILAWARANAWRDEDTTACERAEIDRHLKLASDVDLARELKARGLLGQAVNLVDNSEKVAQRPSDPSNSEITQKGKGSGRRGAIPAAPNSGA